MDFEDISQSRYKSKYEDSLAYENQYSYATSLERHEMLVF